MITVIYIPTDGDSVVMQIRNHYKEMQRLVEGLIERVRIEESLDLWVNDEGRIKGLPLNPSASVISRQVIAGPAFLARHDEEGECTSVTAHDIERFAE